MYVGINKGKVYRVSQKHVKGAIHRTIALWYFLQLQTSSETSIGTRNPFISSYIIIFSDRRQGRSVGSRREILKESTGRAVHIKLNLSFGIKCRKTDIKRFTPHEMVPV